MYNNESQLEAVIQNPHNNNNQRIIESNYINDEILSQDSLNNYDLFNHKILCDNLNDNKNDVLFKLKYFNTLTQNFNINDNIQYDHLTQQNINDDDGNNNTNTNGHCHNTTLYYQNHPTQHYIQQPQQFISQQQPSNNFIQYNNDRILEHNYTTHVNNDRKYMDSYYNHTNLDDNINEDNDNTQSFMRKEISENDTSLPIANIGRLMKSVLPNSAKIAKQAKDMIRDCVTEFIQFIASETALHLRLQPFFVLPSAPPFTSPSSSHRSLSVSTQASDRCTMERRKTLSADDILLAMNRLGFEHYDKPLKTYHIKWKEMKEAAANQNVQNNKQHVTKLDDDVEASNYLADNDEEYNYNYTK